MSGFMPALTGQVSVSAPIHRAFAYTADPIHWPVWIPYLTAVRQTSAEGGAALEASLTAGIAGRELTGTASSVEWDPPTFFALDIHFEEGTRSAIEVELEKAGGGSTVYVTVDLEVAAEGLSAAAVRLMGERMLKHELARAMTVLRQQLDALTADA